MTIIINYYCNNISRWRPLRKISKCWDSPNNLWELVISSSSVGRKGEGYKCKSGPSPIELFFLKRKRRERRNNITKKRMSWVVLSISLKDKLMRMNSYFSSYSERKAVFWTRKAAWANSIIKQTAKDAASPGEGFQSSSRAG